jgi:hypothetical protein
MGLNSRSKCSADGLTHSPSGSGKDVLNFDSHSKVWIELD